MTQLEIYRKYKKTSTNNNIEVQNLILIDLIMAKYYVNR